MWFTKNKTNKFESFVQLMTRVCYEECAGDDGEVEQQSYLKEPKEQVHTFDSGEARV